MLSVISVFAVKVPVFSHDLMFHTLSFLHHIINSRTFITDPRGLAESSAVAVESWGTGPARGKILGPHKAAPGS